MFVMGVGLQVVGRTHELVFIVKYFIEGVSSRFSFRCACALFLSKTVRRSTYSVKFQLFRFACLN